MTETAAVAADFKNKRFRSPPYPGIGLGKAIERAKELYPKALHHSVPVGVLASAWGFSPTSSSIMTAAAALKQFGLLDDDGSGEKRRFRLTDDAIRIVTDPIPSSPKRSEAIKRAALAPKVHAELWEQFGLAGTSGSMDATMQSYLTLDRKDAGEAPYSPPAAQDVISVYSETIRFAGLADADSISKSHDEGLGSKDQSKPSGEVKRVFGGAKIGDLIQWDSKGALQLEAPKRVRAVQMDQGLEWVFVDGSETGIPMSETIVEKKAEQAGHTITPPRLSLPIDDGAGAIGVWKEVTDLDEGDVVLTLPEELSPESYEDLKTWLELILRKAKRRAGVTDI